jgi:ATP-dependent helicase HepA
MVLPESELDSFVQFSKPQERLFAGQVDGNRAFQLRLETLNHCRRLQQSSVAGLLGARIELLPHQLYIANETANRFAPRVLLADEVGLGKTIEAGLTYCSTRQPRAPVAGGDAATFQFDVHHHG